MVETCSITFLTPWDNLLASFHGITEAIGQLLLWLGLPSNSIHWLHAGAINPIIQLVCFAEGGKGSIITHKMLVRLPLFVKELRQNHTYIADCSVAQ